MYPHAYGMYSGGGCVLEKQGNCFMALVSSWYMYMYIYTLSSQSCIYIVHVNVKARNLFMHVHVHTFCTHVYMHVCTCTAYSILVLPLTQFIALGTYDGTVKLLDHAGTFLKDRVYHLVSCHCSCTYVCRYIYIHECTCNMYIYA